VTDQRFGAFDVDEGTTRILRTPTASPIQDEDGVPIPGSAVDACTFTLYDQITKAIINEHEDEDILNTGGGTWLTSGEWALELTPDDNVILDDTLPFESHIALVEYEYNGGKKGKFEAVLNVRNLVKVPE
jgi:hypothetical protein